MITSWHNTVWYNQSDLFAWGDNKFGQASCGHLKPPSDSHKISWVGAQSEAFLVEYEGGSTWAWGWNEHGNLGLGDKTNRKELTEVCKATGSHHEWFVGGAFVFLISN